MRNPRLIAVATLVAVILFVSGFYFDPLSGRRIDQRSFEKIQLGMRREEVEGALGPPSTYFIGEPGEYYIPRRGWWGPSIALGDCRGPSHRVEWNGDRGGIAVHFDADNRAIGKIYYFSTRKIKWYGWTVWDLDIIDNE
jgi:hypothetical protein